MARHLSKIIVMAGALAALGSTAQARQDDDWVMTADTAQHMTSAGVAYSSGVALRVQCRAGRMAVGISGLHTQPQTENRYERTLADGRVVPSYWALSNDGTTLLARDPVRVARSLKGGGSLTLNAPGDSAHPVQVQLELPTQSTGIDKVLTECGWPLSDPRDALLSAADLVVEMPRLHPPAAADRYPRIDIEVSCLIADGKLSACQSDRQNPVNIPLGAETAQRVNGTAIQLRDPAAAEGRVLTFTLVGSSRNR